MSEKLDRLTQAVRQDAAIRRIRKLQPTGGKGDKIFPPTYPGDGKNAPARHVFEHRRVDDENVLCVLVDSVQSQANRLEEGLRAARDNGAVRFPAITVNFADTEVGDIGRITTLDAPHRVFDAIIRDAELDGTPFRESEHGRRLIAAKSSNASALYELSPTALVFGAWNSTGDGGGLGAKFPRAVVSEVVGVNVATELSDRGVPQPSGQRPGSRIDPLGIRSGVHVWKAADGSWSVDPPKGAKGKNSPKELRPSEVNHSNIAPSLQQLGVSVDYLLHSFVLSFAALRRLKFGDSLERNGATQTTLAALGILSCLAQDRAGYFLRSRCDLVPQEGEPESFEIVRANGSKESFSLSFDEACDLVKQAAERANKHGQDWRDKDLVLQPQEKLVQLVLRSRQQALQGVSEAETEA